MSFLILADRPVRAVDQKQMIIVRAFFSAVTPIYTPAQRVVAVLCSSRLEVYQLECLLPSRQV